MADTESFSKLPIDPESQTTKAKNGQPGPDSEQTKPKPKPKRPRKPDYARIHSKPLPLEVYPLPVFIPQNPLSLVRIAYILLKDYISPRSSIPHDAYIGYFSAATRSVHVTDPKHVRALWEMGFFGKGTLSRSEPSWLEREKARLREGKGGTSEEATRARREERRMFKLERARLEREAVEMQRAKERGDLASEAPEDGPKDVDEHMQAQPGATAAREVKPEEAGLNHVFPWMTQHTADLGVDLSDEHIVEPEKVIPQSPQVSAENTTEKLNGHAAEPTLSESKSAAETATKNLDGSAPGAKVSFRELPERAEPIEHREERAPELTANQEHLQLCLEEAFFLSYGLGALTILTSPVSTEDAASSPRSNAQLLSLFATHAVFPPCSPSAIQPDNPFLLNYVVYHHYRSLGWVVRPGSKFSCDFLLYNRGPVFSHAEFALLIIPEYAQGVEGKRKDWWWLHCVNRVQSQVRKTLVLCYVEVPRTLEGISGGDIGRILNGYKIREFVVKRWLANRSRD